MSIYVEYEGALFRLVPEKNSISPCTDCALYPLGCAGLKHPLVVGDNILAVDICDPEDSIFEKVGTI